MKSLHRSVLTSLFTTALDFAVLTLLVELFHVNYVLATFLGTVAGASSNFLINRHWSFEAADDHAHWQVVRFLPVQAGSSALQTLGVWLVTNYAHLPYLASKLTVAAAVYATWNYPMNRFFVFGKAAGTKPPTANTLTSTST